MKNPNNELLPNFWQNTDEGADKWMAEIQARGLDRFLPEPRKFIGFDLTQGEAIFLEVCYLKHKVITEKREKKEEPEPKSRRGAPMGNSNARKSNPLTDNVKLCCSPRQKEKWRIKAEAEGLSLNEWIRAKLDK